MKFRWDKLGGQLGILYCVVGLFLIFLGWNGAASYDRVQAQIPYVVSGGIAGLALVVIGAAMLIVYGHRSDRAALQSTIEELRDALERSAGLASEDPADPAVAAAPTAPRPRSTACSPGPTRTTGRTARSSWASPGSPR